MPHPPTFDDLTLYTGGKKKFWFLVLTGSQLFRFGADIFLVRAVRDLVREPELSSFPAGGKELPG